MKEAKASPHPARRLAALALLVGTAVAWAVPSDVTALVARQEHVLLGRYAEGHLVGLVLWTLLALPAAGMLLLGTRPLEVGVRMLLATASCALGFALVSLASRVPVDPRYVETPVAELAPEVGVPLAGTTRRRQPGQVFEMRRKDRPGPDRSYPDAPPGLPTTRITLTTDALGFRNPHPCDPCDVVVVGDSFTEGSMVSDDEVWTVLVAEQLGAGALNLGVSGATPRQYLNNLSAFGLARRPAVVVVLVYEGNDFKRHPRPAEGEEGAGGLGDQLAELRRAAFKESPLRARLKRWLVETLGPLGSQAALPEAPALAWMPFALETPEGVRHYAFEPKLMMRLDWEPERFRRSPHWTTNAEVFAELKALAERRGIRLVMALAPSKAHVLLPLVRERVSPEALRGFAAFEEDDLPPAEEFASQLAERADAVESVFQGFCRAEGIECVSLTEPLRRAMVRGVPAYFTYDPHWTSQGHAVVAGAMEDAVRRALAGRPIGRRIGRKAGRKAAGG